MEDEKIDEETRPQERPIVNLSQDWFAAMFWVALRLGLSSLLNDKERGEVSDILDKKMLYYFEQHQRLPTGHEIMMMFERTYDDVYNFYHGY